MNEVFICDYIRTPIGRYAGALASVRADDMAAIVLEHLWAKHPVLEKRTDEVIMGCANQAGEDNRNVARMALLLAGYSPEVAGITVNRLCASGMDAVIAAARMIKAGEADIAVAGGVESMSRAPFVMAKSESAYARDVHIYDTTIGWRFANGKMHAAYGTDSMPETAENVAADYAVSRADQDAFALRSQQRTAKARAWLAEEIVPVRIKRRKLEDAVVDADEHPRPQTDLDALARLPTPFRDGGSVTAGNASGVNDGAAALLLASKAAVDEHGFVPLARIIGSASHGVQPRVMGMGPVPAVRKLLDRNDLKITDFSVIELNEAFAAQALAVLRELKIPDDAEHVNANGGAIALGHPLGMSGARITGTAMRRLRDYPGGKALATMCVGVGQGVAIALEAV